MGGGGRWVGGARASGTAPAGLSRKRRRRRRRGSPSGLPRMRHRGQGQPWGFRSQKAPRRLLPPPPSLPPPPPQPPPPPPRRPPPCADGRVRSRRGGASHRGRRHTAQHGPGNQAPLGGKLTGERAGREDHRAFQTIWPRGKCQDSPQAGV